MNKGKLQTYIDNIGIARWIIICFFLILCVSAGFLGLQVNDLISNILVRTGMNGVLVLAMVPAIQCGIGLNFGISLGIVSGILGSLISIEMGLQGWPGFAAAIIIGIVIGTIVGYLYGLLLNRVKGSEMTVSTYVGFSVIALMNIAWLLLPFKSPDVRWPIGDGLRNTVSLDDSFGKVLNNFMAIHIGGNNTTTGIKNLISVTNKIEAPISGGLTIPTGSLLFLGLCIFLVWMFLRSKKGIAMSAAGNNPKFAKASGIHVDKMRILGTVLSTVLSAVGITVYAQSYGFIQLYNAPLMMSFAAVAAILIGGASLTRAKGSYVVIGVFLFQAIISMGLPVANRIIPEGNLSEVMRLIISNGIILYALTKTEGGR